MNTTFKPEGYNSMSPYIIAHDAQKLVDLLVLAFDAKELRRYGLPDGKIMHTELQIDDSILMIADSTDKWPPNVSILHVYLPDVDSTFAKAIEAGFTLVEAPVVKPGEPDKRGTFMDYCGNMWSISTQILHD
ncbi:MAG: VOC family protein [Saprospiraceae bacterium]